MKKQWYLLVLLILASLFKLSAAATIAPDALIKETTDKLLSELTTHRQALVDDHQKLYRLVNEVALPHFDFESMSRLVLGRFWHQATSSQREKFIEQFKTLLTRTYATALFEYNGQEIVYKPFRLKPGETLAVVKTEIMPKEGPRIPFHYALKQIENGQWKIFDVRVDGISLVTNYRTSYTQKIEQHGIDSLISTLADKNKSAR